MISKFWQRLIVNGRKRRKHRASQSTPRGRFYYLRLEQLEDRSLMAPVVTGLSISSAVIDEDGSITVMGTFTNPGAGGNHTVTFDWGNNSIQTQLTLAPGVRTFSTVKRYFDENPSGTPSDTYTITATVFDGAGSGSGTATVTVNNIAPTVTDLSVAPSVFENTDLTLSGTFHDQGTRDTHVITVDWGNPNSPGTSSWSIGQTFQLFPGTQFTSQDSRLLTVTAVDQASGIVSFDTTRRYRDDGLVGGNGTPSDDSLITVTVTDDDTGSGSAQRTVSVQNAAPVVSLDSTPDTIDEGNFLPVIGSFSDLGIDDAYTLTVQWGGSLSASTFQLPSIRTLLPGTFSSTTDNRTLSVNSVDTANGRVTFVVSRMIRDDGSSPGNGTPADDQVVVVTVADDDTGSGSAERHVTVHNVAPSVSLSTTPTGFFINEGDLLTVTGGFGDPGTDDTHTLTVQWGNGYAPSTFVLPSARTLVPGTFSSTTDNRTLTISFVDSVNGFVSFSVSRTFSDDNPSGTRSDTAWTTVIVADDDSGSGQSSIDVTISNNPPMIFAADLQAHVTRGTAVNLTGSFADSGLNDTHTAVVDWGDGTMQPLSLTQTSGSGSFAGSHSYTSVGTFTVTIEVTDDDTGSAIVQGVVNVEDATL